MLNNIQSLRALAAYAVVTYHCLIRFLHPADALGRSYLDLPSGGVDLFFVISGFVMVHTTRDDETPVWFATKRIARIVPLYWLATMIVVALVLIRPWLFSDALLTPDAILASLFFVPHINASTHTYPILGVGWTLDYEMMFYAMFALSLFLPRVWRLAGVVSLITLVWLIASVAGDGVIARFYAQLILFEFAAGCILAHILRNERVIAFVRANAMWPFALAGVAGFAILPALLPLEQPSIYRYGLPALLLVFAAAAQDLYRTRAPETFITHLGDASYSAYLLHPIMIALGGGGHPRGGRRWYRRRTDPPGRRAGCNGHRLAGFNAPVRETHRRMAPQPRRTARRARANIQPPLTSRADTSPNRDCLQRRRWQDAGSA